jgi:hypothetical protein
LEPKTLDQLVSDRIAAKRAEDAAVEARRVIDAAIAAALQDPSRLEGTASRKLDLGEFNAKVTVTYGISRKTDSATLQVAWPKLSPTQQAAFKWHADVSVTGIRALAPDAYKGISEFIEARPATPSVKVEIL